MTSSKEVLLVSGIYYPDIGGPATYIPKLAKALTQEGWKLHTLSLTDKFGLNRPLEPWSRTFILRQTPLPVRIIVTAVKLRFRQTSKTKVFANGLFEEVAISKLLGGNASIAKIVGDPVWERFRNKNLGTIGLEEFNNLSLKRYYKLQRQFLVWSLNKFELITVPSPQLAHLVEKWGVLTEIKVVSNGIQMQELKSSEKKYDVVTVCRLVPWKNTEKLIKVCLEKGFTLAIVGSGPDEKHLKDLGKSPNIFFLGELSSSDVREALEMSKVFCLISSYEGLSHALLEAMSTQIPVVASDIPGNSHVINHLVNGLLVNHQDNSAIGTAILELLRNPDLAKKLSDKAYEDVTNKYSESTQIAKMVDLIEEI